MTPVGRRAGERYGFPTQKPLALYERIIKASSNPGDVVLDPFCGCATTPVAAERLGRRWVAADIWDGAYTAVSERLAREGLEVGGHLAEGQQTVPLGDVTVRTVLPERTDDDEVAAPVFKLRTRRAREPWQKLSNKQMKGILASAQEDSAGRVVCAGCGRRLEVEFMELDHRQPRSDKGENFITNRVLICRPCNGRKSDRLTMKGLHRENKKTGWTVDADRANRALELAHRRAEEARDDWESLGAEQAELSWF